jgi:hypothetical protein
MSRNPAFAPRLGSFLAVTSLICVAQITAMRLPVSQAIERLVRLKLVTRVESGTDGRKKRLATTSKTHILLGRLFEARSKEYSAGLSS